MINLDQYIVAFVSQNWIALSMALGVLKIVAKLTPGVTDDAIHTLLTEMFSLVRGKKQ